MKQKFLIVTFLIFSIMAAFALKSAAQDNAPVTIRDIKTNKFIGTIELLADETTLTETKTGAKIECSNDKVHFKLYEKWQHAFIKYSWQWKKDRHGPYKEYTITVSQKDAELIKIWSKSNL